MGYKHVLDKATTVIKDELKIRNRLEQETDYRIEFSKNPNKYGYDLEYYRWEFNGDGEHDKVRCGFVELERGDSWTQFKVPSRSDWGSFNFLRRKTHEYDWDLGVWSDSKEHAPVTVYCKFNAEMTNCFAAPISAIIRDGTPTVRSDGSYYDSYLKLPRGHDDVHVGLEETVEFLDDFMSSSPAVIADRVGDKEDITEWGDAGA